MRNNKSDTVTEAVIEVIEYKILLQNVGLSVNFRSNCVSANYFVLFIEVVV